MSLFGKLVRTTVNIGIGLPVAIVQDIFTMGGAANGHGEFYTSEQIKRIKDESED